MKAMVAICSLLLFVVLFSCPCVKAMEYVQEGAVMVWEESTGQYVSPATGGVLPPKTAASYFRGMLDGLVREKRERVCCLLSLATYFPHQRWGTRVGEMLDAGNELLL